MSAVARQAIEGDCSSPSTCELDAMDTSPWCHSRAKRALDIAGACTLFVALLPIALITAFAVALASGRPVIYSQVRLGRGMRPFVVYKFRTMRRDAEQQTGPVMAAFGDPRVTRIGKLLRRTRIDEIPQLINVMRGEMSLVGPRPERPAFVREFMREIPGYAGRYTVLPGLTGPAQVAESYHATPAVKLTHDLDYRARATLGYDLRVLLATIAVVLRCAGC